MRKWKLEICRDENCTLRHAETSWFGWLVGTALIVAAIVFYAASGAPARGVDDPSATPVPDSPFAFPTYEAGALAPRVIARNVLRAEPTPIPGAVYAAETPIAFPTIGEIPPEVQWPEVFTEAEMRELLAAAGWSGYRLEEALRVSWCESKWHADPPGYNDNGASAGLFQIQFRWHSQRLVELGYEADPDLLYNPYVNALVARAIVERNGGWGAWTCATLLGIR